jgi:PD-(D/E)XK nuclease superfamily
VSRQNFGRLNQRRQNSQPTTNYQQLIYTRVLATKGTQDIKVDDGLEILRLCDLIRQVAFDLHRYLRHGHLEKVYENGLAPRLRKIGLRVQQQLPPQVLNEDGTPLGDYDADLFVEDCLVVELKSC